MQSYTPKPEDGPFYLDLEMKRQPNCVVATYTGFDMTVEFFMDNKLHTLKGTRTEEIMGFIDEYMYCIINASVEERKPFARTLWNKLRNNGFTIVK